MLRIFVPVDFSDYTINTVNYALKLSQKIPSVITLISCYPPIKENGDAELSKKSIEEQLVLLKQELEKQLILNENARISILTRIVKGYPEDVLVEMSVSEEPDVIIMGTRSKGETIKELLGSITSDVITNANVPVLAVPANASFDIDKVSHILFVTDFNNADYRSFHKLIRLISPFQTKIHAVHFKPGEQDKWDRKRLDEMRLYCHQTYRNYHIEFSFIAGEEFIESLDSFIVDNSIELIAMTRRKRNMISKILHPSITRKILFHTDIPLLVFHR